MISLDQVLLLQQKVESAVAKIAQLQAENDALRSKCSELTNALSSKSEQLSTIELDQDKIESGIKNALNRLSSIENSVLNAVGQISTQNQTQVEQNIPVQNAPVQSTPVVNNNSFNSNPVSQPAPVQQQEPVQTQFYEMPPVQKAPQVEQNQAPDTEIEGESDENQGQFDIF